MRGKTVKRLRKIFNKIGKLDKKHWRRFKAGFLLENHIQRGKILRGANV